MNIFIIFLFVMQFITSSMTKTTKQGSCPKTLVCEFNRGDNVPYVFNIRDVPSCCDVVVVGWYYLDMVDMVDGYIMEFNKNILRALMKNGNTVHLIVTAITNDFFNTILDWDFKGEDYTNRIQPLKNFVNTFNISGIIIRTSSIYNGLTERTDKFVMFINDMKAAKNDLYVSLTLNPKDHLNFRDKQKFDFNLLNKYLRYYFVNLFLLNDCDGNTMSSSINPIKSTNTSLLTLDDITKSTHKSTMDRCKVIGRVQIGVAKPIPDSINNEYMETSYTEYCSTGESGTTNWCSDTSQALYDYARYVSKAYVGISLSQITTDDYLGTCCCQKFPVTKIIINASLGIPLQTCQALE